MSDSRDFIAFWAVFPRKDRKIEARYEWRHTAQKLGADKIILAAAYYCSDARTQSRDAILAACDWLRDLRASEQTADASPCHHGHLYQRQVLITSPCQWCAQDELLRAIEHLMPDSQPWPPYGGVPADGSGLSRDQKRAALQALQHDECAVCSKTGPLEADHDHETGLLRGLLCKSCNVAEGSAWRSPGRFDAYLANPPAGKAWLWDMPDDWSFNDSTALRRNGVTVLEYVLTVRPRLRAFLVDAASAA